jgi:Transglutaminase-like superfamily
MRRAYLVEAGLCLVLARLALLLLPYSWIFSWANRRQGYTRRFGVHVVPWISWSIERAAEHPWIRAICLPRALAGQMMLRRRKIGSRLYLGVARKNDALVAHAWLELNGQVILGGKGADTFTKIAVFGSD